ncbi:MAG: hypothetical protein C0406_04565 [Sideroxydans sp.]|nr:hypothetical protein [Sideroxydans sp.]
MSTAQEAITASRRLAILLALFFAAGYTLNRNVLRQQIELIGYVASLDLLASECAWLNEMGLIEQLELDAVRLTARGEDVALGRSQTPGVRRPSPGENNGAR